MQRFSTVAEQGAWSHARHQAGKRLALVPTMGALHAGHRALISAAGQQADEVVVSIYVNPTQFDDPSDLGAYPRQLERDLAICEELAVAAVFTPSDAEMYPNGFCTFVEVVGPLSDKLCGMSRPGHFRGVATVVSKLFHIVAPDVALFGQKDLQQALIISRLVSDLAMPLEVRLVPTVREADGLAMSSRNARLTIGQRQIAAGLPRGLEMAQQAFKGGERQSLKLIEILAGELLIHPGVDLDYANVVQIAGFEEVDTAELGCVLAAAVIINGVRLIDHVILGAEAIPGVDL